MRLGTKIKELRKRKGLTQIELSERTGLFLNTLPRGVFNPSSLKI